MSATMSMTGFYKSRGIKAVCWDIFLEDFVFKGNEQIFLCEALGYYS